MLGIRLQGKSGALTRYDLGTGNTDTIAQSDVYTGAEDGLLGISLDPEFVTNNWIYLFYSPAQPSTS